VVVALEDDLLGDRRVRIDDEQRESAFAVLERVVGSRRDVLPVAVMVELRGGSHSVPSVSRTDR
jgi:hypothetical protein